MAEEFKHLANLGNLVNISGVIEGRGGVEAVARVDEKGNIVEKFKNPIKIESKTYFHRAFFVPRIRPYLHIDVGAFELEGGFCWKINFAHSYPSTPSVNIQTLGYLEVLGFKFPLPAIVTEVTSDHFVVLTLPVGTYKVFYMAAGSA